MLDYELLRAEYDAAFSRLRRAARDLQSLRMRPAPVKAEEDAVRQRVDEAMRIYRECRRKLADFLISRPPGGNPAPRVPAQSREFRTSGMDRRATRSNDPPGTHRIGVQALAHRLWQDAGKPLGRADEHWYRAEQMLRSGC